LNAPIGAVVAVVFPEMHHPPPEAPESRVLSAVTTPVGGDLPSPPRPVASGAVEASWAAVPKASVDEHCNPIPIQCEVRSTGQIAGVASVPHGAAAQESGDPLLGSRVRGANPSHAT
jgi:hypothetical protein